jgi:hypothetical protein
MANPIKIVALSWMLIAGVYVDFANAGHRDDPLCSQAEALHAAAGNYDTLLCSRLITSLDAHRAELLKKRICRIRDKVKAGESVHRIDSALNEVDHAMIAMQRGMDGCDLRYDRTLQRSWFCLQDEFDRLAYLVEKERLRCRATPIYETIRAAKPTVRIEYNSSPRYDRSYQPSHQPIYSAPVRTVAVYEPPRVPVDSSCPLARPVHHRRPHRPIVIEHHHHSDGGAIAVGLIISALLD